MSAGTRLQVLVIRRIHWPTVLLVAHSFKRLLLHLTPLFMAWRALRTAVAPSVMCRTAPRGASLAPRAATRAAARAADTLDAVAARLFTTARPSAAAARTPVSGKHAACLVPLFADPAGGGVCVWLTRRSKHLRTHAGAQPCRRMGAAPGAGPLLALAGM
jgi:hypothetical protein